MFFYELLWPLVAACIWQRQTAGQHVLYFEDNEGARFSLLGAFSGNFAASLFLATFWGASAALDTNIWVERVESASNPADCLTKATPRDHLRGATWDSPKAAQPLLDMLISSLQSSSFPEWQRITDVYQLRHQ